MDNTKLRHTPSTINLEGEEIVGAPENDGKASMPEQVKRANPTAIRLSLLNTIKTVPGNIETCCSKCNDLFLQWSKKP
jgi:hypothetical protein